MEDLIDLDELFAELMVGIRGVLVDNDLITVHNAAAIEERVYDLGNFILNSQDESD